MINHITHKGVVSHIDGRKVTVLFVQQSACAACSARMLCTSGESKQRFIVADSYGQHFEVGEEVTVEVTSQLAWTAMFFAFGLPAVVALIVVFPAIGWLGEILAPVAALGALVLYYTILYGFRKKLDRRVVFLLHKV
jgi:sigma-E factor negative regulatory protein RseC